MTTAPTAPHYLFLVASAREPGHLGNTEWLARRAAEALPAGTPQTWLPLAHMNLPPFVDRRHTAGTYPLPEGDLRTVLDAMRAASHIVLVAPVYWYSFPTALKTLMDHWSAWIRIPGVPFKDEMATRTFQLVTTSGDRAKAQPMIDSAELCARFFGATWGGALWGKGGPPDAVLGDAAAQQAAATFLIAPHAA